MSLKTTSLDERQRYHNILDRFLDHGQYINGQELECFESQFSKTIEMNYSVGVSSGTDALYLALKILGVGEGDEVIVPALSWYSTALAVSYIGAKPVFADISNDLNICSSSISRLISNKTKAIIPVHYMGNPCDMNSIKEFNIPIVEDCSQAFGTKYQGQLVGSFGVINCFSLNPMKPLGALGDAGIIVTNDESYYERLLWLRYCGMKDRVTNRESSLNFRLDAFQAAILNDRLSSFGEKRGVLTKLWNLYKERLENKIPMIDLCRDATPYGVTILCNKREQLVNKLSDSGIETKIQHDPLMSQLDIYTASRVEAKNAEILVGKILNLPLYSELTENEVNYICDKVLEFYE